MRHQERKRTLSVSQQVIIALSLGILTGLFFGELAGSLDIIGEIFVLLLKMTALPYVTLALISSIGSLSLTEAKGFALKVGGILAASWLLVLALIFVVPTVFPQWESASFFSTSLLEAPEPIDFLALYIPSNPFHSLANNIVPAVVLFSIALGVALIGMENKGPALEQIGVLSEALVRITKWVTKLNPLGVFALSASLVGTMSVAELGRLQVYLVSNVATALLLTFCVLPLMVTTLTKLSYRQVMGHTKDVMILALVTGSTLAVLPLLVERAKVLVGLVSDGKGDSESAVEVLIPAFYTFPKGGHLMAVGFVLFAAWFNGTAISLSDYPGLSLSGLLSLFGSSLTAVPFLLDLYQVPADMVELYISTGVIDRPLGSLTTTMHNLVLGLLGACAVSGLLVVRWTRIIRGALLAIGICALSLIAIHSFFAATLTNEYGKDRVIGNMHLSRTPLAARLFTADEPVPARAGASAGMATLERIRVTGILRAGYIAADLPFTFFNEQGDLVGFDIDLAHALARDLDVALELIPVSAETMSRQLDAGVCDIVISGIAITPRRAQRVTFTASHLAQTVAFIVRDHRRVQFETRESVEALGPVRIGLPDIPYFADRIRDYLPNATITRLGSVRDFFEQSGDDLDALAFTAEAGSAWTLLYPHFSVVIPRPLIMKVPVAYAVRRGDWEMARLVETLLELKEEDGSIASLYDYWVLGKDAVSHPPRWSIIRDVLQLID